LHRARRHLEEGPQSAHAADGRSWIERRTRALKGSAAIALLGLGPLMVGTATLWLEGHRGLVAEDFRLQVLPAAHAVLRGVSPYPDVHRLVASSAAYVYPAPTVVASLPLTAFSDGVAAWVVTTLMIALVPLTLRLVGVRDWRCYGAALLWAPVASAVQTSNLTLPIGIALALAWRQRDRAAGIPVAVAAAAKLFTWPLAAWLLATGRRAQAGVALLGAGAVALAAWAAIGFAGLADYPALARRLNDLQAPHAYSLYALGLELGLGAALAKIVWLAAGLGALAGCVLLGRRGDDQRSFVLAVVASLALSPIVWLHYFAVLLVPLAISRPRLGPAWLLPIALWVVPADGNGRASWQTALALAVAGAVVALCLAPERVRVWRRASAPAPT
jgi:Glycosyltransferase family 87